MLIVKYSFVSQIRRSFDRTLCISV